MDQPRYFFLRGFMKSGTNWVGSLLSSHIDVSCVGEFHWEGVVKSFNDMIKKEPVFLPEANPGLTAAAREGLEEMVRTTLRAAAEPGSKVIGGRTPHTIMPIVIRNTPHIVVMRDGRDVLVSRVFHLYNSPHVATRLFERVPEMAETLKKFQEDPWFFRDHPESLLCHKEVVRLSATWWAEHLASDREATQRFPNLPVLFMRYEDIHADVETERARMFEFLGVDPKRCADIEGALKPGFEKERPDQFLRKGAVGDWKNYFTDRAKKWFNEYAGETLVEFGYADSLDW